MRDYSLTEEEKAKFILRYEIVNKIVGGKRIVIKFATGEEQVIPYSTENEKRVLEIMKKQVLDAKEYGAEMLDKKSKLISLMAAETFFATCPAFYIPEKGYYFLSIPGLLILKNICRFINVQSKQNDYLKSKAFIENEKLFTAKNMNENAFYGVKKKTQNKFQGKTINLNDIDSISSRELYRLISNLMKNQEFGFDLETEDKKTLVKKNH